MTPAPLLATPGRRAAWPQWPRLCRGLFSHRRPAWRMRAALLLTLVFAAGQTCLQAWHVQREQALRDAEAELIDLAGSGRLFSQRVGLLLLARETGREGPAGSGSELPGVLAAAEKAAARLEDLVGQLAPEGDHGLRRALGDWQAARRSLATDAVRGAALQSSDPAAGATRTALLAAQGLVEHSRSLVAERQRGAAQQQGLQTALTLFGLVVFAIGLAEPVLRSVERQQRRQAEQADHMARLALVAECTGSAVAIVGASRRIAWVNPAFERITGYAAAQAIGREPCSLLGSTELERLVIGGTPSQRMTRITHRDGQPRWLDLELQPTLATETRAGAGFTLIASDRTDQRRAWAEQRIAAIAFESLDAIAITDASQVILRINGAFTRITGYQPDEAVGQVIGRLLRSGRHDPAFYAALHDDLAAQRHWHGDIWNRRKSGEVYPERLSITAVADEAGTVTHYVAVFSDLSAEKRAEQEIHHLAHFDALTDLPNRVELRDRLRREMDLGARRGGWAATLFIDMDRFKQLNDSCGHDVGDTLLVEVARRLSGCVRNSDTVARQGGDEFVVLVCGLGTDPEDATRQALQIAEKIRTALEVPFDLCGVEYHGSASVGVAMHRGHDCTVDEALKRADVAMYEAKRAGRNRVRFFDPASHAAMQARLALESDLRQALQSQGLRLALQQQVDAHGTVVGAEVLLRWHHPARGWIPPTEFIPVAEESGLIVPIGQWVLEQACGCLARWAAEPALAMLDLSVNVSAGQFRQPDFVEGVRRALAADGIDPRRLKLELTESLVLVSITDTIAKMRDLKELGVRFALDDFGTGHSSLAYLTRLPIDQLKIDRSFVSSMLVSQPDAVVVQTIIGMARNLGLDVIAEGVESVDQRAALSRWGCATYQGFLYGPAVPVDAFEVLAAPATTGRA